MATSRTRLASHGRGGCVGAIADPADVIMDAHSGDDGHSFHAMAGKDSAAWWAV
jgi:hypothetical protein